MLSREAVEVLKQVSGEDHESDVRAVRVGFRARFGVSVPDDLIQTLMLYYKKVNFFASSIYEPQEVLNFGWRNADFGAIKVDLSAQNARNLHQLMQSLVRAEGFQGQGKERVQNAVRSARAGQDIESEDFEIRREKPRQATRLLGWAGRVFLKATNGWLFSGDDGVFLPAHELNKHDKQALLDTLGKLGRPSDYRVTFVPGRYYGTTELIPERQRSSLCADGEIAEKEIRAKLELLGIPKSQLSQLLIGMDMVPKRDGTVTINVLLANAFDKPLVEKIKIGMPSLLPPTSNWERLSCPTMKRRERWKTNPCQQSPILWN